MKSITSLLLLFILTCKLLDAQEFLLPLNENPVLVEAASKATTLQRRAVVDDTLQLPFEDDFSRPGMYPFDGLWLDSGVYVNNNYSFQPFTIGIATFDGLKKNGRPYHPTAGFDSIADYLTSRPLDLEVPLGDTSVWLFFFYEPQGLGDAPEHGDSLILQFKDTGNVWNTVWAVDGRLDTAWQRVNIQITDEKYLFKGFQLRFYNIATTNGNRDHWNLDYLSLRKNTFGNAPIADNAMVKPQLSLLSEFTSMPYSHYKSMGLAAMRTEINDTIYNIDYGQTSYIAAAQVYQNGASIWNGSTFTSTLVSQVHLPFTLPLNSFEYPSQSTDSVSFQVKSYFSQAGVETNSFNDTSYLDQNFYNYYSYDDGSVESTYGTNGNSDIAIAYKFNVKIQDTLRGVQIYFNPTGQNVTNELFQLTVWSNVTPPNSATEVYRMINQRPDTIEGINKFKTFLFDTLLVIGPGNIWVGIIQNNAAIHYGIGFDKNTDSHTNMYYRVDGVWDQSHFKGSWMIRPLFGKAIPLVSVSEIAGESTPFLLYPNPAGNTVRFEVPDKKFRFEIFDAIGRLVKHGKLNGSESVDISILTKGIYIVRLINDNNAVSFQKLIVQ